jgi:cyclase
MLSTMHMTRRELFKIACSAAPATWLVQYGFAQAAPALHIEPLAEKLSLLTGAGGNIAILQGQDGLLLVDSGLPATAEAVEREARSSSHLPITVLINTHYHFDHVGANVLLGRAGARIIAHENVLKRLSTPQRVAGNETPPLASEGLPKTTFTTSGSLEFGAEKVEYRHLPPSHTDGDATIRFEKANVYHAGDLFFNGMYPYIDYAAGGSIEGMVTCADLMIEAVDQKTKIIPGHGPMATRDELRAYRSMLADVNERVSKLVQEGKTLEETQAAEPTKPHDDKWGKGFMKPAAFVGLLYAGKAGASKK